MSQESKTTDFKYDRELALDESDRKLLQAFLELQPPNTNAYNHNQWKHLPEHMIAALIDIYGAKFPNILRVADNTKTEYFSKMLTAYCYTHYRLLPKTQVENKILSECAALQERLNDEATRSMSKS